MIGLNGKRVRRRQRFATARCGPPWLKATTGCGPPSLEATARRGDALGFAKWEVARGGPSGFLQRCENTGVRWQGSAKDVKRKGFGGDVRGEHDLDSLGVPSRNPRTRALYNRRACL